MYSGVVNETNHEEQRLEISADNTAELMALLKTFPGHRKLETAGDSIVLTLPSNIPVSDLSRFVFEHGIAITHLVSQKKSLETQFLEILNEQT